MKKRLRGQRKGWVRDMKEAVGGRKMESLFMGTKKLLRAKSSNMDQPWSSAARPCRCPTYHRVQTTDIIDTWEVVVDVQIHKKMPQ